MSNKDIFISYRDDVVGKSFAGRLAEDLKQQGYGVYFNPDEEKGQNFPERLQIAIQECKDFICIVTDSYLEALYSETDGYWVRRELLYAREYQKKIFPLLFNNAKMPADASNLPEEFKFFPYVDAYVFSDDYLLSQFTRLCGKMASKNDGEDSYRDVYNASETFNPDKVLEDILAEARSGNVRAMYEAGVYYYYGISTEQDERKAAIWFKKVSESGGDIAPLADKFIGRLYFSGTMPREEQSYEKSFEYHMKAAASNDLFSAGHAGYMQTVGCGCPYDYERTEKYYLSLLASLDNIRKADLCEHYMDHGEFEKAAKIYETMIYTYPVAAYQMGVMYKRGVLCKPFMPDYFKAAQYFQIALNNKYLPAAYELGMLYFRPTGGFRKDFNRALDYFAIAAESGITKALYMLGFMYRYGHVKKDIALAIEYLEKAAEQGDTVSAAHLAILYQQPDCHNYEKAFKYCKIASDRGNAPSEFLLGTMYLSGRGCNPDADKAYLCFENAAKCGAPEAKIMLDYMDKNGI